MRQIFIAMPYSRCFSHLQCVQNQITIFRCLSRAHPFLVSHAIHLQYGRKIYDTKNGLLSIVLSESWPPEHSTWSDGINYTVYQNVIPRTSSVPLLCVAIRLLR